MELEDMTDTDLSADVIAAAPSDPSDPWSVIQFLGELADVCVEIWTQKRCDYCRCARSRGEPGRKNDALNLVSIPL